MAHPTLALGTMDERTTFETAPEASDEHRDDDGRAKATPALFWTGVALGGLGTAGTLGFATAGKVVERKIDDGYDDGFSSARHDELESRGETWNALAITSLSVGLVGLVLAATVYGIDYTRCGPLAPTRRRCPARQ
jgi:hypothetical protein